MELDERARGICEGLARCVREDAYWDDTSNAEAVFPMHNAIKEACMDTLFLGPSSVNDVVLELMERSYHIVARVESLYSLIDPAQVPEQFADIRCDIESEEFSGYKERTSVHHHRISEGYRELSAALRVFMEESQRSLEVTGV
ncbi:hypothetical protein AB0D34_12495 [Streptomyces sp. NPDC048420]|uniref:hypothetical protein n=1 Tax=Streptomyces sp. NPDC048420 TaxID=3155755 RepID=UPI00342E3679